MDQLMLIINPISGTFSKDGLGERIRDTLSAADYAVDIRYTEGVGDATRLARYAVDHDYYAVVACGGDGTINETAAGLCGSKVALGIVPAGSGNGLARHIAIPMDPMLSLDIIIARDIMECDYGLVNGRPFFCTFGVGFDAAVSSRFANADRRGKFTYLKSALEEFINYKPRNYDIEIENEHINLDAFILTCCNASQFGNNAYISPTASITDGFLDMVVIHKASQFRTFLLGFDLMAGVINNNSLTTCSHFTKMVINREVDEPVHIDGEVAMVGRRIEVECVPHGLRLFVKKNKSKFRPIITPAESLISDIRIGVTNLLDRD